MASDDVVTLDLTGMLERFQSLGPLLAPSVYVAMLVSAEAMVKDVIKKRLSGPRGSPGVLGIVTGGARRSMTDIVEADGGTIKAILGSALKYVRAHEVGFSGSEHVRAHDRRRLGAIRAVSIAPATRGLVSRRSQPTAAQRRAGPIHVRAFDRKVNIIAKHFIRDTVLEAKEPTASRIERALVMAFKTGRPPTTREVGA